MSVMMLMWQVPPRAFAFTLMEFSVLGNLLRFGGTADFSLFVDAFYESMQIKVDSPFKELI
jgi:hypothetical protein